jgi:hypothetical protein
MKAKYIFKMIEQLKEKYGFNFKKNKNMGLMLKPLKM